MRPSRSDLTWGLVGGLSFLVLLQAYELAAGVRVDLGVKFGVAVLVAIVAAGLVPFLRDRLPENGSA